MKRFIFTLVSVFFFFGCSEDEPTSCPICANPLLDSSAVVEVTYITDGDTFEFIELGEDIKVRVLGLDCFETKRGSRLTEQALERGISEDSALSLGFQAKYLCDSLLMGEQIEIYRDSVEDNFDSFGRLLRHVYVTKGGRRINYQDTVISLGLSSP